MKQHSTNYFNTLITIAEDSKTLKAEIPPVKLDKLTVANRQFDLLNANPGQVKSDDLLFQLYADKNEIPECDREQAREAFFSKGQPCLRTSPLAKSYGWGILYDEAGNIRLIDAASEEYENLLQDNRIKKVPAMRSTKK